MSTLERAAAAAEQARARTRIIPGPHSGPPLKPRYRRSVLSSLLLFIVVLVAFAFTGLSALPVGKVFIDQYTYNQPECPRTRLQSAQHNGGGNYCSIQHGLITAYHTSKNGQLTLTINKILHVPPTVNVLERIDPKSLAGKIAYVQIFRDFQGDSHVTLIDVRGSGHLLTTSFLPDRVMENELNTLRTKEPIFVLFFFLYILAFNLDGLRTKIHLPRIAKINFLAGRHNDPNLSSSGALPKNKAETDELQKTLLPEINLDTFNVKKPGKDILGNVKSATGSAIGNIKNTLGEIDRRNQERSAEQKERAEIARKTAEAELALATLQRQKEVEETAERAAIRAEEQRKAQEETAQLAAKLQEEVAETQRLAAEIAAEKQRFAAETLLETRRIEDVKRVEKEQIESEARRLQERERLSSAVKLAAQNKITLEAQRSAEVQKAIEAQRQAEKELADEKARILTLQESAEAAIAAVQEQSLALTRLAEEQFAREREVFAQSQRESEEQLAQERLRTEEVQRQAQIHLDSEKLRSAAAQKQAEEHLLAEKERLVEEQRKTAELLAAESEIAHNNHLAAEQQRLAEEQHLAETKLAEQQHQALEAQLQAEEALAREKANAAELQRVAEERLQHEQFQNLTLQKAAEENLALERERTAEIQRLAEKNLLAERERAAEEQLQLAEKLANDSETARQELLVLENQRRAEEQRLAALQLEEEKIRAQEAQRIAEINLAREKEERASLERLSQEQIAREKAHTLEVQQFAEARLQQELARILALQEQAERNLQIERERVAEVQRLAEVALQEEKNQAIEAEKIAEERVLIERKRAEETIFLADLARKEDEQRVNNAIAEAEQQRIDYEQEESERESERQIVEEQRFAEERRFVAEMIAEDAARLEKAELVAKNLREENERAAEAQRLAQEQEALEEKRCLDEQVEIEKQKILEEERLAAKKIKEKAEKAILEADTLSVPRDTSKNGVLETNTDTKKSDPNWKSQMKEASPTFFAEYKPIPYSPEHFAAAPGIAARKSDDDFSDIPETNQEKNIVEDAWDVLISRFKKEPTLPLYNADVEPIINGKILKIAGLRLAPDMRLRASLSAIAVMTILCLMSIGLTLPKALLDGKSYVSIECSPANLQSTTIDIRGSICSFNSVVVNGYRPGPNGKIAITFDQTKNQFSDVYVDDIDNPGNDIGKQAYLQTFKDTYGQQHVTAMMMIADKRVLKTDFNTDANIVSAFEIGLICLTILGLLVWWFFVWREKNNQELASYDYMTSSL